MVLIGTVEYESNFGGIVFSAGREQGGEYPTEFAAETIIGGAGSGDSYHYVDWFSAPPDTLDLPILLPDRATLDALAALRGYPIATGGVPYELHTTQFQWQATLDKLSWSGAWYDTPVQARAVFTKVADLGISAPSVYAAPVTNVVYGANGLTAEFDVNGSTSEDGVISSWSIEYGDAAVATFTGPWTVGSFAIPTQLHTYAAPGVYVVNVSVKNSALIESDNYALLVEVAS